MARKNTQDASKKHLTWKFYTILSSIIGLLIIAGIITSIVVYNTVYSESYNNKFSEYTKYKRNYNEIEDLFDDKYEDGFEPGVYTIIFAYDDTYMDQGEIDELDSDDPNRSRYEKCNAALKELILAIQENEAAYAGVESEIFNRIDFYFINTSLLGNSDFLSDENYGNVGVAPSVILLDDEGKNVTTFGKKGSTEDDQELSNGKGDYNQLESDLKELKELVVSYNPENEE